MLTALSILLTILKGIGILLLILLALIVLIVCLVLFGPVVLRFRVSHTDSWSADGNISWLKVALKAVFTYEEDLSFTVRIFGRTVYPKREKPKHEEPKQEEPKQEVPKEEEQQKQDLPMIASAQEAAEETKPSAAEDHEKRPEKAAQPVSEKETAADADRKKKAAEKEKSRGRKPEKTGRSPLKGGSEVLSRIRGIVGDEAFQPALDTICSAVGGFFGSIYVYELKGDAVYALGAPDLTGIATGVVSLFPAAYGEDLTLTPDFTAEEVMFSGELEGGLRFRLVHLLIAVVKVIKDKNVRKMVHLIRK